MSHACLLKGLLLGEYILKYLFNSSKSSKRFILFFLLLYQGLYKIFQDICNFQKFWSLFISPLSAKKHTLQCLMNVF
jgi:hypothetical protein